MNSSLLSFTFLVTVEPCASSWKRILAIGTISRAFKYQFRKPLTSVIPVGVQIVLLLDWSILPVIDDLVQRGERKEGIAEHDVNVRLARIIDDAVVASGVTVPIFVARLAMAATVFTKCVVFIGNRAAGPAGTPEILIFRLTEGVDAPSPDESSTKGAYVAVDA